MTKRVAVVVSHPIQHFVPQYSSWARLVGVDIKVFFASRQGLDAYEDKGFGRVVNWDQMVLDFNHEFLPGAAGKPTGSGIDCIEISERLQDFSPDAVVVYGYSQALQRRTIRWATGAKVPLLMIADSELRRRRSRLLRPVKAIILPRILRKIDLFLTVGDANEAYYRHYGALDETFIRCSFPVDVKAFDAVKPTRSEIGVRLREELGIPSSHKVVLTVGKLVPGKRQADLIAFSNAVQSRRRDITVVLAGSGHDEESLKAKALKVGPGGVLFAGFVHPSKLVEYYAAADLYAHCSEVEAHSLAISEAIYSGLPVVASNRCGSFGPSDDVRPGLNGFVYPCGNIAELSSALMMIIDRIDLQVSMGRESEAIASANQALAHGKALMQSLEVLASGKER